MTTYMELFLRARRALLPGEGEHAGVLARELLAAAAGKTVEELTRDMRYYAPEDTERRLEEYTARSLEGEPTAYIIEKWDFYDLTLTVTPAVLIPRDDTTAVTDLALHRVKLSKEANPRVLDLCAGSGCIGLAIASRVRDARVTCGELSEEAIRVLRRNIQDLGLSGRVMPLTLDAKKPAGAFLGKFDLIVSNPPYVTTAEMAALPESVARYEPAMALHGGTDGLDFYRAIVHNYLPALRPGGHLCLEFGRGQENAVCRILGNAGLRIEEIREDGAGIPRAVAAISPQ